MLMIIVNISRLNSVDKNTEVFYQPFFLKTQKCKNKMLETEGLEKLGLDNTSQKEKIYIKENYINLE